MATKLIDHTVYLVPQLVVKSRQPATMTRDYDDTRHSPTSSTTDMLSLQENVTGNNLGSHGLLWKGFDLISQPLFCFIDQT